MLIESNDFEDGGTIPLRFTCEGGGARPGLFWSGIPEAAKSLAISLVDPDAPNGDFIHWIVVDVPVSEQDIESGEEIGQELPNSTGGTAYTPPCPPYGEHRYIFTLYALDVDKLDQAALENFFAAIKPHTIDQAKLTGLYQKRIVV